MDENYSQQELFEQEQYISDLIEKKTVKKKSSINVVMASGILSSILVLSFLYLFGIFDEEEIVLPDPVTITETITEKELVMPRVDSTEIVSIAELATKTIVQVQVGILNEDGDFLPNGGGSGVVISNDGLIMTNHHVIDESNEVRVIFEDGRMYESQIIGSDKLTDVGLLKINAANLFPISIGNSDILSVGDLAVAIGHPLTLGAAPTSAVAIAVVIPINSPLLFINAPPLEPLVIGASVCIRPNNVTPLPIVSLPTSRRLASAETTPEVTVGAEGLGFAVPINLALSIADDLIKEGQVFHAFLGILGSQHFETAADGARVFSGVYIQELYGPTNDMFAIGKAGALPGDIIKKVNGETVKTLDGLITELRKKRAGDSIEIEILRNEQYIILDFELDLRPSDV